MIFSCGEEKIENSTQDPTDEKKVFPDLTDAIQKRVENKPEEAIEILRKYSKKVMAVDITNNELKPLVNPNMVEIMRRADIITSLKLKAKLSKEADILVKPDVSGIHWSDFNNFDKLLDSGRDAMTKVLDNLKSSENSKKNKLYNLFESAK